MRDELERELRADETKAWQSLRQCKFPEFGYWPAFWETGAG
jgi:hypothetical protein